MQNLTVIGLLLTENPEKLIACDRHALSSDSEVDVVLAFSFSAWGHLQNHKGVYHGFFHVKILLLQ